ncbi:MAG: hypothetical protein JXA89_04930 [Anaerolineae bacterium]|nr:hypothetical protein [Anaerolineae bacterium]
MSDRADVDRALYLNGINATTGKYDLPPIMPGQLSGIIERQQSDEALLADLKRRQMALSPVGEAIDPQDLSQTGWGILFAAGDERAPAIKEALSDLLARRQEQAGARYYEFIGPEGYRGGESRDRFLSRHGAKVGIVDPDKVPYYLLIVGDPEHIPYDWEKRLGIQYAVGRIDLNTLPDYEHYARSVVQAETGGVAVARQAAFFAPGHANDPVLAFGVEKLVKPLIDKLAAADQGAEGWEVHSFLADRASKAQLSRLLCGDETSALLFAAAHGLAFDNDDPRQAAHQGALLCQEWPGPEQWQKEISPQFYFSADDVGDDARVAGSMGFFVSSYGAGTPKTLPLKRGGDMPAHTLSSRLPGRLLSHPQGGMVAVVGYVGRTWGHAFSWERADEQITPFYDALQLLIKGYPVGWSMNPLRYGYVQLGVSLEEMIKERDWDGGGVDDLTLCGTWAATNDLGSVVIVGDPAASLPLPGREREQTVARSAVSIERQTVQKAAQQEHVLSFNGVNGTTGTYGLAPMTDQALSDHIFGRSVTEPNQGQVKQYILGEIQGIVADTLDDQDIQNLETDQGARHKWADALSKKLEALFEVAGPDNRHELERKLEQDVRKEMMRIQREMRAERIHLQQADAAVRSGWFATWLDDMGALSIDALESIGINRGDRSMERLMINALDVLNAGLAKLAGQDDRTGVWLGSLVEAMDALLHSRRFYWRDVIQTFREHLDLERAGDDGALWRGLIDVLNAWLDKLRNPLDTYVVKEGVDVTDLAQAGWGIIFGARDKQAAKIKEALGPLLRLREKQAGERFRVYEKGEGYRPGETASDFLSRHNVQASDPADPEMVPYYLLIVGSPADKTGIPFHVQYQLDVQYGVGRIDFGDDLEAYANYARSVVAAETANIVPAPRATFIGVNNPGDRSTELSAQYLIQPLSQRFQAKQFGNPWQVETIAQEEATKARILDLIKQAEPPAFLFTASHGMEFDKGDANQVTCQGGLLCQDWPGPGAGHGAVPADYYLTGQDLTDDMNLRGMIAFLFACYGAGTPLYDAFSKQAFKESRETITEAAFVAALPQAMLNRPQGGALAVIGHVERTWAASFLGTGDSTQITVFEAAIERLLKGYPVGAAMEYFNGRYAALSTELTIALEEGKPDPYELARMWTENNDARGYIVLGDPAVHLPVALERGANDAQVDLDKDDDW